MDSPRVLIAMAEDFVGITRLPRVLSRAGIHVSVLSDPRFLVHRSRFVQARYPCGKQSSQVVDALKQLADPPGRFDWIILGDDTLLKALAREANEPWARALLPIDLSRVPPEIIHSKTAFVRAITSQSGEAAISIPQSWVCGSPEEIQSAVLQSGFPLILKEDFGQCGSGVRRFNRAEELNTYLQQRTISQGECVIQKYVSGINLTVDALFDRGRVRTWVSSLACRTCNGPFGSSTARRFVRAPELAPAIAKVGQLTGAHGLVGLDFIVPEAEKKALLLEINFRPTSGHSLAEHVNVNFGEQMRALLKHEPIRETLMARDSAVIPMFPEDWDRAITDKDWNGMLKWMFLPTYWPHLPWSEPTFLFQHALSTVRRLIAYPSRSVDRLFKRSNFAQ